MDCCTRFAKFLLCLFNFMFFVSIENIEKDEMDELKLIFKIVGSVILTLGVWIAVDKYNFLRITKLDAIIKVR